MSVIEHNTTGLDAEIEALGPWFHNVHLPDGTQTYPDHWLGDFPSFKWSEVCGAIPEDLAGWKALDIGCNAGFYSFELAKRGAQVVGIDHDPHYLRQAEWARAQFGFDGRVEFRQQGVYDLAHTDETFDLVLFLGVLYHLRYPMLGLDIVASKVGRMLLLQTLTAPGDGAVDPPPDLTLDERVAMDDPGWPKMAFIERRMAGDPTNWWAPTAACVEAMVRTTGLRIADRPAHEFFLCERDRGSEFEHDVELRAATGRFRPDHRPA